MTVKTKRMMQQENEALRRVIWVLCERVEANRNSLYQSEHKQAHRLAMCFAAGSAEALGLQDVRDWLSGAGDCDPRDQYGPVGGAAEKIARGLV